MTAILRLYVILFILPLSSVAGFQKLRGVNSGACRYALSDVHVRALTSAITNEKGREMASHIKRIQPDQKLHGKFLLLLTSEALYKYDISTKESSLIYQPTSNFPLEDFVQLSSNQILIIESHSIQELNRETDDASTFAGNLEHRGNQEGNFLEARFEYPKRFLQLPDKFTLLVTDNVGIRKVCLINKTVTTLFRVEGTPYLYHSMACLVKDCSLFAVAYKHAIHTYGWDDLHFEFKLNYESAFYFSDLIEMHFHSQGQILVNENGDVHLVDIERNCHFKLTGEAALVGAFYPDTTTDDVTNGLSIIYSHQKNGLYIQTALLEKLPDEPRETNLFGQICLALIIVLFVTGFIINYMLERQPTVRADDGS